MGIASIRRLAAMCAMIFLLDAVSSVWVRRMRTMIGMGVGRCGNLSVVGMASVRIITG